MLENMTDFVQVLTGHLDVRGMCRLACTCRLARGAVTESVKKTYAEYMYTMHVYPGDGFFDVYTVDGKSSLRLFEEGPVVNPYIPFNSYEFEGRRHDVNDVLIHCSFGNIDEAVPFVRTINEHMHSGDVKGLWIREIERKDSFSRVALTVRHAVFRDMTIWIYIK